MSEFIRSTVGRVPLYALVIGLTVAGPTYAKDYKDSDFPETFTVASADVGAGGECWTNLRNGETIYLVRQMSLLHCYFFSRGQELRGRFRRAGLPGSETIIELVVSRDKFKTAKFEIERQSR
jgi:hypothetical protein